MWRPSILLPNFRLHYNGTPCQHCGVRRFVDEKAKFCCGNGSKAQYYRRLPPYPLDMLPVIHDPQLSALSRKLNLIFSFAALQTTHAFPNHGHPSFFAVQGRVYHQVRATHANSAFRWFLLDGGHDDSQPFLDNGGFNLPAFWIPTVRQMMSFVNPLARQLLHMRDLPLPLRPELGVILHDPGVAAEVAAIMFLDNTARRNIQPRDMTVIIPRRNADGSLATDDHGVPIGAQSISVPSASRYWEPLAYPLLFPHGTLGHGFDGERSDLSLIWHVRQRLLREPRFDTFGRLTNEYITDMWSRHLEQTLHFINSRQLAARAAPENLRNEANDAMNRANDHEDNVPDDQNIYLPANFVGGRAWSENNVANCLALAATLGQPTLFVTVTCNPHWPEIQEALLPGQTYPDRPIIVNRVFHARLQQIMTDLRGLFPDVGPPSYWIKVIEFQKRGLPHAHILLRYPLELSLPESIDSVVSACRPMREEDAALIDTFMRHRHPSPDRPKAYCQREIDGERVCKYGYPHLIRDTTAIDQHTGRIHYRRLHQGDEWIVPHCLPLLRRHLCHINVEVASTSALFQYLFKYVHKGPDYSRVAFRDGADEVFNEADNFHRGRHLSATEAAWRILGYHIADRFPGVDCLPVHLPGRQTIRYGVQRGAAGSMSDLLRYFHRPRGPVYVLAPVANRQRHFDELSYTEYFRFFRHESLRTPPPNNLIYFLEHNLPPNQVGMRVIPRQRLHVTRITVVRTSQGELFYLRALLGARPARSFDDLRTVDGELLTTYQEAASRLGLFAANDEAHTALQEGVDGMHAPSTLRQLFVDLLLNGADHPVLLWEDFGASMSLDITVRADGDQSRDQQLAMASIARMLGEKGKSPDDYGLPMPEERYGEIAYHYDLYADRRFRLRQAADERVRNMNDEQRSIFDAVLTAIDQQQPLCAFIDGKAGRGKTFLVAALLDRLRSDGKLPMVGASSAFAALLYEGGTTIHSLFKVPVNERNEELESSIQAGTPRARLLQEACCFFWDEAPMANKAVLACVDVLLRQLCDPDLPFGGKPFVLLGDFRQCAPVVRGGSRIETVQASIRSSHLWQLFVIHRLLTPIRNAADLELADIVDAVGDGIQQGNDNSVDLSIIPRSPDSHYLINFVFPVDMRHDPTACLHNAILCATNSQCDEYNRILSDSIIGEIKVAYSTDTIKEARDLTEHGQEPLDMQTETDFLNAQHPSGIPPHVLHIKTNTIVRLLRNFSQDRGLVKNVRMRVSAIGRQTITCNLIRGVNGVGILDDVPVLIPRITFEYLIPRRGYTLQRRQFPLAPAYATTFNSCQGLTLKRVGLDMTRPAFSHGQLYTSISRVATRQAAMILHAVDGTETPNVVYPELLI